MLKSQHHASCSATNGRVLRRARPHCRVPGRLHRQEGLHSHHGHQKGQCLKLSRSEGGEGITVARCQRIRTVRRQFWTSPARRAQPSPWASERSVSKNQQIGRGRRHPGSVLSADQDGEEAVSYFTGKKGSTITMGIRKVSVHNSADLQGEASAVAPVSCCNTSELAINRVDNRGLQCFKLNGNHTENDRYWQKNNF
jgi:hypothetical protein